MRKIPLVTMGLMMVFATLMLHSQFVRNSANENWLAVVIVTENHDPDYDRYGYRCGSYTYGQYTCGVYVYNPVTRTLRYITEGDGVLWSPSGRYLAVVRTVSPIGIQTGNVINFSVYDMQTDTLHQHNGSGTSNLVWSPDERYLIVTGWASSGLNGSNAWFDVLNGDGTGELPDYHSGFPGGIMGSRGGRTPIGWTVDGYLVIRDTNNVTDRDHLMRVNIETGDAHDIDSEPDNLVPFYTPTDDGFIYQWGATLNVPSPDGQFVATVADDWAGNLWERQTPMLTINGDDIFTQIDGAVPDHILDVQRMAWRPLSP